MKTKPLKRIFICSPFAKRGRHTVEDNIDLAKQLCLRVVLAGHAPYAPHLFFPSFLDDSRVAERAAGVAAGVAWLGQADQVWVYAMNSDDCSVGMQHEVDQASKFYLAPKIIWMPPEFLDAKWAASGPGPQDKVKPTCLFCAGTGKLLEGDSSNPKDSDSRSVRCPECFPKVAV